MVKKIKPHLVSKTSISLIFSDVFFFPLIHLETTMLMPFKNDDQLPGRSAPGGYRRCWDCGSRPLVLGLYLACRAQVSPGAMARAWCVWVWEMDLDEWMTLGDIGIYSHLTGIFIFIYGIYGIVGIFMEHIEEDVDFSRKKITMMWILSRKHHEKGDS
jgi:hypothetical protein